MLHRLHCYIFQSLYYSAAIKKAMAHVYNMIPKHVSNKLTEFPLLFVLRIYNI